MNNLIVKQVVRLLLRRNGRIRLNLGAVVLLSLCVGLFSAGRVDAQADRPTNIFRHHVIFLLDASGSVTLPPGSQEEYFSVIRTDLRALLDDVSGNGFGTAIYDPQQDLSSAFAFGLSKQRPFFEPSLEDGFLRRLWFQERGKDYNDLVNAAPPTNLYWTAINSAFIQGVRKARWEAEQWGTLGRGFNRTFLVIISDGKSNTSTNSLDEMGDIHSKALEFGLAAIDLKHDRQKAAAYYEQLTNLYALSATGSDDPGQGTGYFLFGHYKIFIRELRPQKLVNLGDLLERGPDQETQLERSAHDMYVGTLSLSPHQPRTDKAVSYELVGVKYRLPGQSQYQTASIPSSDHPFAQRVEVSGDEIDHATADFQLSFLRRDPYYGQAVQVFEETIHFRREPRKYVLGVIPITDFAMTLHPGLNQDQIKYLDSILIMIALVILIYILLFPAPRAAMELRGEAGGATAPFLVAFSRSSQQSGQQYILRKLRFKNTAFRTLPILGKVMFRLAERRFDVNVNVTGEFPQHIIAGSAPVIGLDEDMRSEQLLKRQTEGSDTSILLSPEAVADYEGEATEIVECAFTVQAKQTGRRFWFWPFSRELDPQTQSFYLRFEPEEPDMQARLEPRLADHPTGETETRLFPQKEGITGWLILPHYRGRKDEPDAIQEFDLRISNNAVHNCSKTGSATLNVVLSRADGRGKLVQVPLEPPYQNVIRVKAHQTEPLSVSIRLPYEDLPLPSITGDDYILEATLTAAAGQQWAPQTVRYGVRVGPDERRTALSFKVAIPDKENARVMRWRPFDGLADSQTLRVKTSVPVRWNVGENKEYSVFAAIQIDNVARTGDGHLLVKLKPEAAVRPHPESEPGHEPEYADRQERKIVHLLRDDEVFSLGEQMEWSIANESTQRPIRLGVQFQPYAIARMERRPPKYRYVCDLPFECRWRATADEQERQFEFRLQVEFEVQRYSGEHALAIDFGTSAVVVAFEESEHNITRRYDDVSYATQRLQERYQELLNEWRVSPEIDLKEEFDYEARVPNLEHDTAFIPSALLLRQDRQIGEADFVILPVSLRRMSGSWDRTVYYLKGLILRGDEYLRYEVIEGLRPLRWKDAMGNPHRVPRDQIAVDEIIRSTYRNLFANYVEPLLAKQGKLGYLDRLVISHPNSFTLGHIHRVKKILTETFPQFSSIHLLSESNAVAIYCARNARRFFRKLPRAGEYRHLLVYDIGAGTVDLTYTRLEWSSVEGATRLKEMKVLFKAGIPVAGNRLDECLAVMLDRKIRALVEPLREKGISLKYTTNAIVDPPTFDPVSYPARMLRLKRALQQLKVELAGTDKEIFHVPISAAGDLSEDIVTIDISDTPDVFQAKLKELNIIRNPSDSRLLWIGIPISRKEIFEHQEIKRWLDQVANGLISDFGSALKDLGIKPEIDTLILSGRTAEFPPLRQRLVATLRSELGLEESTEASPLGDEAALPDGQPSGSDENKYFVPKMGHKEKKEAVALGSLLHTIFHGRDLRLVDRNIWAKYGIIYNDGTSLRFQEFFGYASDVQRGDEEIDENGIRTVFYRRTLEIARADGPLEIAATFSRDPDAELRKPQADLNGFILLRTIGAEYIGEPGKLKVHMRNNKDDTITINIDPDGFPKTVQVRGYRPAEQTVQMEWPYQPLKRKHSTLQGATRFLHQ